MITSLGTEKNLKMENTYWLFFLVLTTYLQIFEIMKTSYEILLFNFHFQIDKYNITLQHQKK